MEVNDQTLGVLRDLLISALSHDNNTRKNAENYIKTQEMQPGFPVLVLTLIQRLLHVPNPIPQDIAIRQSAAVLFKNIVKKHWSPDEDDDNNRQLITLSDKEVIKAHLVELMTTSTPDVQKQLAEAVSLVAKHDFPEHWQNLLPQLVSKLQTDDITIKKGVMLTANSIMKRFRYVYKSDELYSELLTCLTHLQEPLLKHFQQNFILIQQFASSRASLLVLFETQRLICRVFFSLNWQDIPEYFEDHIAEWMTEFARYLNYTNPLLVDADNEDEPGPIELLQAAIIENISFYVNRYEDIFSPYLPTLTPLIWTLLVSLGSYSKFDILAVAAIKFLTCVCSKQMNISLFNETVLTQIIESIVIQNIKLTASDEETFCDNAVEYIRKDMEGGDGDTRRRCAMELLRALMKYFANTINPLVLKYTEVLFSSYYNGQDYIAKDAALHLIMSVLYLPTTNSLVNTLNPTIDINGILNTHIVNELTVARTSVGKEILKADCIKFISMLRGDVNAATLTNLFSLLVPMLSYPCIIIQSYASMTMEKILCVKDKDPVSQISHPKVPAQNILSFVESLVNSLIQIVNYSNPANGNDGCYEYMMKCLMRVCLVLKDQVVSLLPFLYKELRVSLERVMKQPIHPYYNHYLFEVLAICISHTPPPPSPLLGEFEVQYFPLFQQILTQDISEFIPYVFQILAILLFHYRGGVGLTDAFRALFLPLLSPVLWEKKGNVPALTDLFRAYVTVGGSTGEAVLIQNLTGVLGVFQKLVASKATEIHAFALLNTIYTSLPLATLTPYLPTLFQILLKRLQESVKDTKVTKYARHLIVSLNVFVQAHGSTTLIQLLESLTPGLIHMLLRNIWAPNGTMLSVQATEVEKQYVLIGGTQLLMDATIYNQIDTWGPLVQSLVMVCPTQGKAHSLDAGEGEEEAIIVGDGLDTVYSKLVHGKIPSLPVPTPPSATAGLDSVGFFISSLAHFLNSHGNAAHKPYMGANLSPDLMQVVASLCQQYRVSM